MYDVRLLSSTTFTLRARFVRRVGIDPRKRRTPALTTPSRAQRKDPSVLSLGCGVHGPTLVARSEEIVVP